LPPGLRCKAELSGSDGALIGVVASADRPAR
jgi:hypothetical protein